MDRSPKRLAQRQGAAVDLTPCGQVVLHVGPMALQLDPEALVGLHELLGDALAEVGYPPAGDRGRAPSEPRWDDDAWMERIARRGWPAGD